MSFDGTHCQSSGRAYWSHLVVARTGKGQRCWAQLRVAFPSLQLGSHVAFYVDSHLLTWSRHLTCCHDQEREGGAAETESKAAMNVGPQF